MHQNGFTLVNMFHVCEPFDVSRIPLDEGGVIIMIYPICLSDKVDLDSRRGYVR